MSQMSVPGHLIIPQDKVPVAAYQAIYHKLTTKVEKLRQVFEHTYEITVEDIVQLHNMLCQTVRQYPVKGSSETVAITFHKFETLESSSVDKFRMLNFSTSKETERIEYEFDFYSVLPVEIVEAEDIVQRFKVTVSIDQDFMEEDDGKPYFLRGMFSGSNVRLAIEYADYAVARNLQVCVQDWVKSLPIRKDSSFIKFLEARSETITYIVPYLLSITMLIGVSYFRFGSEINDVTRMLVRVMAAALAMFIIGKFLSVEFFRNLQILNR